MVEKLKRIFQFPIEIATPCRNMMILNMLIFCMKETLQSADYIIVLS